MASAIQIIRTVQSNVLAGLTAAGLQTPGQVIIGWPTADDLSAILGAGSALVSIFPQKARPNTRFRPIPRKLQPVPVSTLVATVAPAPPSATVITFSGVNQPSVNVHTLVGPIGTGRFDTLYQTTGSETLAQIATAIAAKVNVLSIPGVVATPSGSAVSVTGPFPVSCHVGLPFSANPASGNPIIVAEIGRFTRDVLVGIWSPQPDVFTNAAGVPNLDSNRESVEAAVLQSIGGSDNLYVVAPDGSAFRAEWQSTGDWDDRAQSSYSTYKSSQFLSIEYALFRPYAGAPVGAINVTSSIGSLPPSTQVIG